ncbi:uncharacterized protein Aud_009517, partial [Aspergillus udagawae]
ISADKVYVPGGTKDGTGDAPNTLDAVSELAKKAKEKDKACGRRQGATQGECEGPTKFACKKPTSPAKNDRDDCILLVLKAFQDWSYRYSVKYLYRFSFGYTAESLQV